jgi:hypothetical protein
MLSCSASAPLVRGGRRDHLTALRITYYRRVQAYVLGDLRPERGFRVGWPGLLEALRHAPVPRYRAAGREMRYLSGKVTDGPTAWCENRLTARRCEELAGRMEALAAAKKAEERRVKKGAAAGRRRAAAELEQQERQPGAPPLPPAALHGDGDL